MDTNRGTTLTLTEDAETLRRHTKDEESFLVLNTRPDGLGVELRRTGFPWTSWFCTTNKCRCCLYFWISKGNTTTLWRNWRKDPDDVDDCCFTGSDVTGLVRFLESVDHKINCQGVKTPPSVSVIIETNFLLLLIREPNRTGVSVCLSPSHLHPYSRRPYDRHPVLTIIRKRLFLCLSVRIPPFQKERETIWILHEVVSWLVYNTFMVYMSNFILSRGPVFRVE